MKKRRQSVALFTLAILSLLFIGAMLITGTFKDKLRGRKDTQDAQEKLDILGEMIGSKSGQTSYTNVNNLFQETAQDTKEVVSQKIKEIEKVITNTIKKEVSNLTYSQLKAIQLQICKDWKVISPVPTSQP